MTRRTTLDTLMALLVFAVLLYVAAQQRQNHIAAPSDGSDRFSIAQATGLPAGQGHRGASQPSDGVTTTAPRGVPSPAVSYEAHDVPRVGAEGRFTGLNSQRLARAVASELALPDTSTDISGTSTWYCGAGSRCAHGYGPGSMVAAAGSELRRPGWRGSWVRVHANGRHVDVQLVDWCLCRGSRIVDLYGAAFSRLAPTSRGEIFVTVEWLGPRLPPTDTGGTP